MFFHEVLKLAQPRPDRLALIVSAVENVRGLEAVARDARDGKFVALNAAVCIKAGSNRGGDAAGRFGEDAFSLRQFLDSGDDLNVGNIFGPSAGLANGARGVEAVCGVADGERAGDRVGTLRLNHF